MRTEGKTLKTGRGVATVGRRRLFAWLLPFTLLAGFVSGSTPAHATFPGASESIAFMKVVGNGTKQLFTIEPDGGNEQQLTDFPTASIVPRLVAGRVEDCLRHRFGWERPHLRCQR